MNDKDVVKTPDDFAEVNFIYAEFSKNEPPAKSCFKAANLPTGGMIAAK